MFGKKKEISTMTPEPAPATAATLNNPYLNARQEWMERYGNYIHRAAQWRMTAMIGLFIAALSLTCNVIQMTQSKIDRYFVAVDDLGKTVAEKIQNRGKSTPEKVVQSVVAQAIVDWRTVTVDRELQNQMIKNLNMHIAGTARGMLKEWYEQNSPFTVAKSGRLVNVEIKGIPLPVSSGSYRVEWTEIVRNIQGNEMARESFEAIVSIEIIPPQTDEMVMANPGGVYITNLSTAKRLGK